MTHSASSIQNQKFPKYDRYKDSGVEWLGEVPEHWNTEKGKWLFVKMNRPVRSEDDVVTAFRDGQVTLRTNRRTEGFTNAIKEHGYQGIRKGDLVIHAMDAFAGAIGVSDSDGKSTPVYSACVPRKENSVSPSFYAYLLRYMAHSGFITTLAKGIRERSTDFRYNDFGAIEFPLPPKSEQDSIVAFLDQKTAEIDALIAKKKRQIELLDEQKAILINRAVTRGLNPKAKLKPSGIEWIGDIPANWKVVTFRRLIDAICDGPFGSGLTSSHYSDSGTRVIRLGNIGKGSFKDSDKAFIPDSYAAKLSHHQVVRNDLLVAGLGDSNNPVGRACVYESDEPAIVKADCYRVRLKDRRLNGFLAIYLSSQTGAAGFSAATRGSTRSRVNLEITKEVWIVRPAVEDLKTIEVFVSQLEITTQKAVSAVESQIQSLQALRNTLIAHAVTGNIKI